EHTAWRAPVGRAPGDSAVRGEEGGRDGLARVGVDRLAVHGEPERGAARDARADASPCRHSGALLPNPWPPSSFTSAAPPRWARPCPASSETTSPSVWLHIDRTSAWYSGVRYAGCRARCARLSGTRPRSASVTLRSQPRFSASTASA